CATAESTLNYTHVLLDLSETSIGLLCSEDPSIFDLDRTRPGQGRLYFHSVVFPLTTILAPGRRSSHHTLEEEDPPQPFLGSCLCLLHVL
ncbi:hypothetical protein GOODEAATRI_032173, partial [Goodea atripinnis]